MKIILQFIIIGFILGTGQDAKPTRQEIVLPDQYIAVPADFLEKLKKAEREIEALKREREQVLLKLNAIPSVQQRTGRPSA